MSYTVRLKEEYRDRVVSALKEEFSYSNVMQVPKLKKIVLSRGVGGAVADKKQVKRQFLPFLKRMLRHLN